MQVFKFFFFFGAGLLSSHAFSMGESKYPQLVVQGFEDPRALLKVLKDHGPVTQISMGWGFGCAIAGRNLKCWGANDQGQANPPNDLIDVSSVATGISHACAIGFTQTQLPRSPLVKCWGSIQWAPEFNQRNPLFLSSGFDHMCASFYAEVVCWGIELKSSFTRSVNRLDEFVAAFNSICLVTKTLDTRCEEFKVPNDFYQIASGISYVCGFSKGDSMQKFFQCLGLNIFKAPEILGNVFAFSASPKRACALQSENILCWGHETLLFNLSEIQQMSNFDQKLLSEFYVTQITKYLYERENFRFRSDLMDLSQKLYTFDAKLWRTLASLASFEPLELHLLNVFGESISASNSALFPYSKQNSQVIDFENFIKLAPRSKLIFSTLMNTLQLTLESSLPMLNWEQQQASHSLINKMSKVKYEEIDQEEFERFIFDVAIFVEKEIVPHTYLHTRTKLIQSILRYLKEFF